MKKISVYISFLCLPLLFSCNREKPVMCTEEYRMLTVSIRDSAGNPVLLNHYFVRKTSTGDTLDFSNEDPYLDSINRSHGIYPLFSDGNMSLTSKTGTEFEFHGTLGTAEVVNERYLVGNDGCHVTLLSGRTGIIISR